MRARRTDANHTAITAALRQCGYAYMNLHTQGGGCEDILVAGPGQRWILLEAKAPRLRRKDGVADAVVHTAAQRDWYARTAGYPRIIATSAEDAIKQLRAMERGPPRAPG